MNTINVKRAKNAAKSTRAHPVKSRAHIDAQPGYVMQVCSRCDGTTVDPESPDCRCDVCGGTGAPTKEQYAELVAERNKLREVARRAHTFLAEYDRVGGMLELTLPSEALDRALDALKVVAVGSAEPVDPYWID
jgi:hypothetical protein